MQAARLATGLRSPRNSRPIRSAVKSCWARLLDGEYPWGRYDLLSCRNNTRRYRLTLLRPDITAAERRLFRLWSGWPVVGGMFWLLSLAALGTAERSPATALAQATGGYVAVSALLFAVTQSIRAHVRSLLLVVADDGRLEDGCADDGRVGEGRHEDICLLWQKLATLMVTASSAARLGAISPVEFEALWWQAYRLMGAEVDR